MKKLHLFSLLSVVILTACSTNKPVEVVKGTDNSTFSPQQQVVKQVEIPANLSSNVTAICRDGSHSTAKENACAGNGGVATAVRRYHSE